MEQSLKEASCSFKLNFLGCLLGTFFLKSKMCIKNFLKQSVIISQVSQQVPGATVGASFGSICMDLLFLTGFQSLTQSQYKLSSVSALSFEHFKLCVYLTCKTSAGVVRIKAPVALHPHAC